MIAKEKFNLKNVPNNVLHTFSISVINDTLVFFLSFYTEQKQLMKERG